MGDDFFAWGIASRNRSSEYLQSFTSKPQFRKMEDPPAIAHPAEESTVVSTPPVTNSVPPTSTTNHNRTDPKESQPDGADGTLENSSSSDTLTKGLSTILSNVIRDFDSQARTTLSSQDQLNSSIDRLTGELDRLLEDAPLPFIMQHAAKISSVRKRVSSLNSLLRAIQRRIDNMDRALSMGMQQEKTGSGTS
ncbi:unnamed protein product [Linum tenue]|uniref:Biogenesis of lysosome-related organelles complex 1 subunit 7 n=1 Tax=Linum tenue TaxID=586396 RepID=A0AAV0MVQ2_9ROSI|nr:unnamed protein product [Linum tenue]